MNWMMYHSLLHLTSEGRIATSTTSDLAPMTCTCSEPIVHPWSSSTCCIQVFLGRPGGRFQSGAGHLPCERLTVLEDIAVWHVCSGRRETCHSSECLLSAMMRGRSVSFVWLRTESLVTKSYHFMLQDAPLCLHVKSLQSGRVGFGQSPRLRSMQQDGLNKRRVEWCIWVKKIIMFSRLFDREMDRQTDGLLATAQSALCIQRRVVKIQVACSCRPKLMKYRQCWSTHDVITCRRDLRPKSPNASSEKVVEQYSPKKTVSRFTDHVCHASAVQWIACIACKNTQQCSRLYNYASKNNNLSCFANR